MLQRVDKTHPFTIVLFRACSNRDAIKDANIYNEEMEQEQQSAVRKLVDVAKTDFSNATAVRVSFPDQWQHVETIKTPATPLYIAGFPIERAFTGRNHFHGLAPEINVNLIFYQLYKLFQPWPLPQVTVDWDRRQRVGSVVETQGYRLQLQPIGQAQAWFGIEYGVVWECLFEEAQTRGDWQTTLRETWQVVEEDILAPKLFTLPDESMFRGNYREFLKGLGYATDREMEGWWSKTKSKERIAITLT